jgi:hypothetical protein
MPALGKAGGIRPVRRIAVDHWGGRVGSSVSVTFRRRQTVDFFQTWFLRDGGRRVFVQWAPVATEVKLLVDIDVLIPEDFPRVS